MRFMLMLMMMFACVATCARAQAPIAKHVQDVTVGIDAKTLTSKVYGSGVLISKELTSPTGKVETYNFILTAGHVVSMGRIVGAKRDGRTTEQIIVYPTIHGKKLHLRKNKWEQESSEATILKTGYVHDNIDFAVLLLTDPLSDASATFDLNEPCVGTEVFVGAHFPTQPQAELMVVGGMISTVYTEIEGALHHQADCIVRMGASGGGVFLAHNGACIGITTYQTDMGCAFVPMHIIAEWLEDNNLAWLIHENEDCPSIYTLLRMEIE